MWYELATQSHPVTPAIVSWEESDSFFEHIHTKNKRAFGYLSHNFRQTQVALNFKFLFLWIEKVGVGQDPLVFFRLHVVISLNSVVSLDFMDLLKWCWLGFLTNIWQPQKKIDPLTNLLQKLFWINLIEKLVYFFSQFLLKKQKTSFCFSFFSIWGLIDIHYISFQYTTYWFSYLWNDHHNKSS